MGRGVRSSTTKAVNHSRRELLENQLTWLNEADKRRQEALQQVMDGPCAPQLIEPRTAMLTRRGRSPSREGNTESDNAAGQSANNVEFDAEAAELMRLRKRIKKRGRSRGRLGPVRGDGSGGSEAARFRVSGQQLARSELKSKTQDVDDHLLINMGLKPRQLKSKSKLKSNLKSQSGPASVLSVQSRGVTKRVRGKIEDTAKMDDSDSEGGNTEDGFTGGVELKGRFKKSRKNGNKVHGSDWIRKVKTRWGYGGPRKGGRGSKKFKFQGVFQFYPKPEVERKVEGEGGEGQQDVDMGEN